MRRGADMIRPALSLLDCMLIPIPIGKSDWLTGVIDIANSRVHLEDPTGGLHPETAEIMVKWVAQVTLTDVEDWLVTQAEVERTPWRLEGGVYMIADMMCIAEGLTPSLNQSGGSRFRRWLSYLLWASGELSFQTSAGSIIGPNDVR